MGYKPATKKPLGLPDFRNARNLIESFDSFIHVNKTSKAGACFETQYK